MKFTSFRSSGFTLIELMIVISIIVFLVSFAMFPYSYYMKRAYVERSQDTLGQTWIKAHKDIRNGKLFSSTKHANMVLIFEAGAPGIGMYLLSGTALPKIGDFTKDTLNVDILPQSDFLFDSRIEVLGFSGFTGSLNAKKLGYLITAPYGTGIFFTDSEMPFSSTGIFLLIGYTGANLDTGFARQTLLRPYLQ